jgi:cytochrome b561
LLMNQTYKKSQKILHWLLAFPVLFWLFVSGALVESSEGADKAMILPIHSGGAIIILCLMIFRFRLRLANTVIPSAALKPYERIWSVRTHLTMYALVLLMVLSGIGQGIFFEQEVRIFGFINITLEHNESIVVIFHFIHETTANIFKLLIAIHILAALKHQFIDRNGLLKRMS